LHGLQVPMWNGQCHLQQHLHLQVLGGAAGTLAQSKQDAVVGWERMRAREHWWMEAESTSLYFTGRLAASAGEYNSDIVFVSSE
jgi:hypothetical protein